MKSKIIILFILISLITGCAGRLYLYPIDNKEQTMFFHDGEPVMLVEKKLNVFLGPLIDESGENRFVVMVKNKTEQIFDLSTENIIFRFNDKPIKVFTHDEITKAINSRYQTAAFLTALGGGMQSAGAGLQSNTYHQGSFAYNGSNGYGNGTYSGYSSNPVQAQMNAQAINQNTRNQVMQIESNKMMELGGARSALKKTTVFPSQTVGGFIQTEKFSCGSDYKDKISVVIRLLEEEYVFDSLCGNLRAKSAPVK